MTNAEIQVGEYVRTNNARGIRKIARINEDATINKYLFIDGYDHSDTIYGIIRTDQITNHSFNLIDLIEVGDYVNEKYIQEIKEKKENEIICLLDSDYEFYSLIKSENIKTIVTKEQFKAMEYKVGGEND